MGDSPYAKKARSNPEKRANALTALLNEIKPSIVTLQEAADNVLAKTALLGYSLIRDSNGLAILYKRDDYYVIENGVIRNRMQVAALNTTALPPLGISIINLHLPILNRTVEDRRDFARTILADSDQWRIRHKQRFEVISGDFNLPPYDEVIVGKNRGFCANRDKEHCLKHVGTVERGLFNSSWQIFGGQCGALGTYYLDNLPHGPWHIPDQVMLDPGLIQRASVKVQVLIKVNGISLTTPRTLRPEGNTLSDHFPMLVSITPDKP